jgi:hypothetical protein
MKKKIEAVKGRIENLKRVVTRTENSMITFTVGGTPCKAFGKGAETVARWMQLDPNSAGEFEGYFEKRSEKYGREFVAVHGKPIQAERIEDPARPLIAASGFGAPGATSAAPSAPIEPVPAKESGELNANPAVKASPTPLPCMPQASTSLPVVDSAPVKQVTFEDLENEYKVQKLKRQLENSNQQIATA